MEGTVDLRFNRGEVACPEEMLPTKMCGSSAFGIQLQGRRPRMELHTRESIGLLAFERSCWCVEGFQKSR